ncbi:MAG: response regulator transcription factor [Pseudobacteriovorax sp.]|nr:response regulator transcription factor [Pseudobacteriovorax sp.]
MKAQRILLIDDEPLACENLKLKLSSIVEGPQIHMCHLPEKALEKIEIWKPDVVFLDIQMPGMTGFELLSWIPKESRNFILIFCTAYSEYAIQAFDEAALDYLLKPVDPNRLKDCWSRVSCAEPHWADKPVITESQCQQIKVQQGQHITLLAIHEVLFCQASHNETIVVTTDGRESIVNLSLNELEARLSDTFVRCHRSYLVNKAQVTSMKKDGTSLEIRHWDGEIPVSRRLKKETRQSLFGNT